MPYQRSNRLPGEKASKLGHLDVINSDLVKRLIDSFNDENSPSTPDDIPWEKVDFDKDELPIIFGIDGSIQSVESERPPYKKVAFVKTALLRLDQHAISKIDKLHPHPLALKDILLDSAIYHATVFPLRYVTLEDVNTYDANRKIIYESMKLDDNLGGEILETLKWIVYEKWNDDEKKLPEFECPHCRETGATLDYDEEEGECPLCGEKLLLTDMLGFHQVMAPDSAPEGVARDYMNIHETLLLFSGVKYYWKNDRNNLSRCLFVKDGPLSIRAQYSKIVNPIRRFLAHARDEGHNVHLLGQEKSGKFFDHIELIGDESPNNSVFIPKDKYIREEIQHRHSDGAPYGKDTNYGGKILLNLNRHEKMVLNVPTGEFNPNPDYSDFIGLDKILSTIPSIRSMKYESGLLPIELAHGVASLSTYPSAQILKIFAGIDNDSDDYI